MSVVVAWLQFLACAVLILLAGRQLSRYGDVIAEKTGLGGTWVGLVLLATVTSLPELITGVSAVLLADAPDIAVGNVLGANVINLVMIVVLDALARGEPLFARAALGHILSAGFGVILAGFVGFNILFAGHAGTPALGHVGLASPIIVVIYAAAMLMVFRYERTQRAQFVAEVAERYPHIALRQAWMRYALAALVVVAAALWLPFAAEALAQAHSLSETFVGTLFVALATTLPEMTVTVTALRLGAIDMAIGNLFGSNLFNLAIIAVDDLFYLKGPLLAHVSDLHAVSALSAVMMSGIAIVGLLYRPRSRLFGTVGWVSLMLLSVYLLNTFFLYLYGG
ncbi:MAG: sodium:calcium antiporter [Gammaproteobacteria bacterium]|nr:MAG: sodium:calcium antiporter [Gammaproteobacteria bacterium]